MAGEQEARIVLLPMNRVVMAACGTLLSELLHAEGIGIESICGGKGTCRKCRVILERGSCGLRIRDGTHGLDPEESRRGYRLACQTVLNGDATFTIPVESRIDSPKILLSATLDARELSPSVRRYPLEVSRLYGLPSAAQSIRLAGYTGPRPQMSEEVRSSLDAADGPLAATVSLAQPQPEIIGVETADSALPLCGIAIDLGTTTVVGCLADLQTGHVLATASAMNQQISYGEELLTRIGYADHPAGRTIMQEAAAKSIRTVIGALLADAQVSPAAVADLCIGGNTVMNHLLLGLDCAYLDMANAPVSRRPLVVRAADIGIGLHAGASAYCLPNVSRFVGGDAVGDVITSGMHLSDELSLLIDLGTNGEIVLGNREWLSSVSCASGPAFEGAGIRSGMRAMKGAIDHVRFDPATGRWEYSVIGDVPPRGICGSGIVDAAAMMVRSGVLDFAGKIRAGSAGCRTGAEGLEFVLVPSEKSGTGADMAITQADIDYLMDSKAAACGSIAVLLKRYKVAPADIRHVYLAGAFGAYTDLSSAVHFGILPHFASAEFHPIGNGSLSGAYAALVSRDARAAAERVAAKMVYIDLIIDADFIEEYSAALYIPGRQELFAGLDSEK